MKATIRLWTWTRWAPLLALTAILAACGAAVTSEPAAAPAPAPAAPADRQATCDDSAIRLLDRGAGVHGAIVADTLHMGGAEAPATCLEAVNQSLAAGLPMPAGRTEQAQQSRYYLIVINYPGGNRLYVLTRRADGTTCVVDTNDRCIAQVTDLPDDFDLKDLPDDVAPTIPAGRPTSPAVDPPPGGDDAPPTVSPPPGGDDAPPAPSGAASDPQPRHGATGVGKNPLLSWTAAPRALSYDFYLGATKELNAEELNADPDLGRHTSWPINTLSTSYRIASVGDLQPETLYYWRVDAKTEAGVIRGNVWSFTTKSPVGTASNPQPSDGATGVTVAKPLLSWAAAPHARRYRVIWTTRKVSAENRYTVGSTGSIYFTSSFRWFPYLDTLAYGQTYYWWVEAYNDFGRTLSDVWSFTTAPQTPEAPEAPAWPAAASDVTLAVRSNGWRVDWTLPLPTGHPKPVISIVRPWPVAVLIVDLQKLRLATWGELGAKGTITLVASNSEGSANLAVPYDLTCRYTLAETIERNRGSWVTHTWPGRYNLPPGKYSAVTIGDTITTVPASSAGELRQDVRGTPPSGKHVRGHTHCDVIFHPDYILSRNQRYSYRNDKHAEDLVGCERILWINGGEGGTYLRPAGCDSFYTTETQPAKP